jgi:hypothetical protein
MSDEIEYPDDSGTAASAPAQVQTYPALWYTSGTPLRTGQMECAMRRYLGNHAGRHGTGYRRKTTAVPLATGHAVHVGHQLMGEWILDFQKSYPTRQLTQLPDEVIAWAANEAAVRYEAKARSRGLTLTSMDADAAAAVETMIMEQRTLIEALIWVYALVRLPYLLTVARLIAIELECTPVLDCTCGLGDWIGNDVDHAARGCQGIVDQGRGDGLWQMYEDGSIIYEELKTKATERKSWEDAWEHSGQLWLNTEAASKRLGVEVNASYVPILFKGWRGRDKNQPSTAPKYQHSELCYGWLDQSRLDGDLQWAFKYKWYDDYGKEHRLGNNYKRTPLWDPNYQVPILAESMLPVRPEAGQVERWIKGFLPPMYYGQYCKVLGPFPRQRFRLHDASAGVLAEERLWRYRVDTLRANGAFDHTHPMTLAMIPRSWNCTGYDGTPCDFKMICDKEPGWESIEGMGYYQIRGPHHAPEKVAFEQCGLVFPLEGDEEFEEEE